MKTLRPPKYIFAPALFLLAIFSLTTCQKELVSPQKNVAQAQNYFESQILTDTTQKVQDNNPRHSIAKEPLWAEASVQNMPFGQAVVVPLVYQQAIALQTQSGNIPLSELSYLLIYKDAQKQYHTEVITKLPEKNYWPNYKNPEIPFKGVILVEDWWGNTLKNIGLGITSPENLLGYVAPQAKGQIPPNNNLMLAEQHCYNQYWTITVCNMEGTSCVTVHGMDPVCFTVYTDNGGGGGGSWSGTPSPPDYGYMPHAGAGGYNTPPPPPPPPPANLLDTNMTPDFYKNAKAMCALNTLMQNSFYKTTLNNFIGENKPLDITFKLEPIANQSVLGHTDLGPEGWNTNDIFLTLNENVIGNSPSIEVALTLLHEGIHAEIFRKILSINGPSNLNMDNFPSLFNMFAQYKGYQHEFLANYYIDIMGAALKKYDSSQFTLDYYKALAWEGLEGTDVYINLNAATKADIQAKTAAVLANRSKTNCNDRYAE
jgi:hypothetical protein